MMNREQIAQWVNDHINMKSKLLNLYWYIIDNDIQNDFINVCGKNKEEQQNE